MTRRMWFRGLATAVIAATAIAVSVPASASTRLNDVQWGKACTSRDFYATVSANAEPDGQPKIDLVGLKFGARLDLLCGGVTKVCIQGRVTGTSSALGWAGSTPFGGLPLAFASSSISGLTTKTPVFNGTSCYSTSSSTFTKSITLASEQGYVFTGGRVKLKQVKIESRAYVVVSGATYYTPWASQTYSNPLV